MRCFVFFGTVEGHTYRVAEAIADGIGEGGHEASVHDISNESPSSKLKGCDACLIAAPVHQQRHPDEVINFAMANAERLNTMPSALISVSLAAAFPDGSANAQSYVDRLLRASGWTPTLTHCAAGALRSTKYDFFQEQVIRHVVLQGRDFGTLEGDHVFTDWDALGQFVQQFISTAAPSSRAVEK